MWTEGEGLERSRTLPVAWRGERRGPLRSTGWRGARAGETVRRAAVGLAEMGHA